MNRKYRDEDWLREKYKSEQLTLVEISNICGVAKSTIIDWCDRFDIERRDRWEHQLRESAAFRTEPRGYEEWYSNEDGARYHVRVHRLLAVSEYGISTVANSVVHHRNGLKWDNRPSNIEVHSNSNHAELHDHERDRNQEGQYV